MDTHTSYDLGIKRSILGNNKSGRTKTICDKIVKYEQIDDREPTCADCKKEIEKAQQLAKEIFNT